MALVVKNLSANAGDLRWRFDTWVRKIPWRRAWRPTPWRIAWTEEPGGLQSTGSQRVGYSWSDSAHACTGDYCALLPTFLHMWKLSKLRVEEELFWVKEKKKKILLNYSFQWNGLLAGGHYYLAHVFKAKACGRTDRPLPCTEKETPLPVCAFHISWKITGLLRAFDSVLGVKRLSLLAFQVYFQILF